MYKRYSTVFPDVDIDSINSQSVTLQLVRKELCDKSNSYIYTHGLIHNFPDWCRHLHSSCVSAKHQ